jgi:hypothetical protein
MAVVARVGSLQFDPLEVAGRNHDLVLLARVAGYRREMTDRLLYTDRTLYETYNKMLSLVPTAELPWHRLTWDLNHEAHRGGDLRRARAARGGAAGAHPGDRSDVLHGPGAAGRDRLVLAPDEPGAGDPRGARGGRDPRDRAPRGQPPGL